jgi:hypothetical protein
LGINLREAEKLKIKYGLEKLKKIKLKEKRVTQNLKKRLLRTKEFLRH